MTDSLTTPMTYLSLHNAIAASLLLLLGLFASTPSFAQICTREYTPICGQAAGDPAPKTYPNRCVLNAAQATALSNGECTAQQQQQQQQQQSLPPLPRPGSDVDAHGCKPSAGYTWNEELNSCVRPWMSSAVTLEIAPKRRTCMGMVKMQCLLVREITPGQPKARWEPLFSEITGFTHVPGKHYKLRVRKDRIENPPADAPDTTYTLLKVLSWQQK